MRHSKAESNAIVAAMLIAGLLLVVFYARYQLVYSTRLILRFIEVAFGS